MATERSITSLFVVLLSLNSALLYGDAIPQGYHTRHRRANRCPTCPRDCSEKLSEGQVAVVQYVPAQQSQAQYTAPPSYNPHPTSASYVTSQTQPQVRYSGLPIQPYQPVVQQTQSYRSVEPAYQPSTRYTPQASPAYNYPYNELPPPVTNYDPYDYSGYDYDCSSCRSGRSLDINDQDDYAIFGKYNRRSLDESSDNQPREYNRQKPLPFADESSPPADFYKNYRMYVRESDRPGDESEEQPSRRRTGKERERLFVVYRADAFNEKPSDSELESVIRQAMDVARQQKAQEEFTLNGRRNKINRYHYELDMPRDTKRIDFKALKEDIDTDVQTRFNLSPGPLMNAGETYITEEGDEALNPGLDQSKWTIVPSLSDLELMKSPESEIVEEIEAAVSVVPETPKMKLIKVPKVIQKDADTNAHKGNLKKETIEVLGTEAIENKREKMVELIEDVPTPSIATESTIFERPSENVTTSAPTINVLPQ